MYKIIFYDLKNDTQSEVIECHEKKDEAIEAVKKYRKQGLPAFYQKGRKRAN